MSFPITADREFADVDIQYSVSPHRPHLALLDSTLFPSPVLT